MKRTAIIKIKEKEFVGFYDGKEDRSQFEGENADPKLTKHIEFPKNPGWSSIKVVEKDGELTIVEDLEKTRPLRWKKAKAKFEKQRLKMDEAIQELVLGIRNDQKELKVAFKALRKFEKDYELDLDAPTEKLDGMDIDAEVPTVPKETKAE